MRWHSAPVVINVVIIVTGSKIISLGVYFGGARARAPLFANFSSSSHPALPDHPPVSVFLDPRSLLISSSPSEQYPSLHHVFGWIYQLNSALQFLFHLPSPSLSMTHHYLPLASRPRAVRRRHCVGGGAPVNFGRRRRGAAWGTKSSFSKIHEKISFYPQNFLMNFFSHQALR